MRILITGATGLIGRSLTYQLLQLSHQITVLSRHLQRARDKFGDQVEYWTSLNDQHSVDGFDAIINLAGEPIADKRWSRERKKQLCHSRWTLTERLVELIHASARPPSVFISGSAVGYYGDQQQATVTEDTAPHNEFTQQLCQHWESLALRAQSCSTRVCLLRTGVVLAADGGMLAKILPPFRLGLGGVIADGCQYFSWIHLSDMVNGIIYLLDNKALSGPFNMVAPCPVTNQQFTTTLARVIRRPTFLRIPAFAMQILMGEAAVLVLGGQCAVPKRLEEAGFSFHFVELEQALEDIIN